MADESTDDGASLVGPAMVAGAVVGVVFGAVFRSDPSQGIVAGVVAGLLFALLFPEWTELIADRVREQLAE